MKRGRKKKPKRPSTRRNGRPSEARTAADPAFRTQYAHSLQLALDGQTDAARLAYGALPTSDIDARQLALVRNDVAALDAVSGDMKRADAGFRAALELDGGCQLARANLACLADTSQPIHPGEAPSRELPDLPADSMTATLEPAAAHHNESITTDGQTCKIAVLSFLFGWPSTGGGIVHTVELVRFLRKAGYDVQHMFARYEPWGIGRVTGEPPLDSQVLEFDSATWNVPSIQDQFHRAVRDVDPDCVIITDCWNFKPLLAEAVEGFPYLLRQQALECVCPLNNLRLLVGERGEVRQCELNQLATPDGCADCLRNRGLSSGALHQAERALSGVGSPDYHARLLRAFANAEAVLVLNPSQKALLEPFAERVKVVTWGMDGTRFPWPVKDTTSSEGKSGPVQLLMAGLIDEFIKGYHILHAACAKLWQKRRDFELVVTADPAGPVDKFTRYAGWLSQEELPHLMRSSDVLIMPTIAQEGLGRTTVEAMACGLPVIASRIGGLPYTVSDGTTGLLFEPGNVDDLAQKIETLLESPELRHRFGVAGRRRFEQEFTWETVIERDYGPLLETCRQKCANARRNETTP